VVLSADAQVPLGHALSADRRRQVLDWSRQTGGHVLELACDAVPRLATAHLPRLLTADTRARIVLIGDLGEVVTPTLKVGYAVVPRDLAQSLRAAPEQPSYLTQLAVTHLITQGALHRRMKRLAGLLDRKLPLVRAALGALHGRAELFGLDAVGTVGLRLIGGLDAEQVGADLARSGLVVPTMAGYRNRARPDETELLLGYPHLTDPALRHGLSRLAAALTRL
jgi:GntR family transcriptional regulator/MocR family aminotransferase